MTEQRRGLLARLEPRHVVLAAAAAALLAFLPSLTDGFVFDDEPLVVNNPFAHDLSHARRCFTTDLWDTPERPDAAASTRFYRPAVCVSYILNYVAGGGTAWSFHLVNVLLHVIACALAARLALRWTGAPFPALVAALIFSIHPTRTENVEWVSGRTDVLMAAFLFAAHELAVHAAARRRAVGSWSLAAAAFALAVLSKEYAICWPLLLVVEALWTPGAPAEPGAGEAAGRRRRLLGAALVSSVMVVAYLAVRAATLPIRPKEIETMALPLPLHAGYVALTLGYYVERTIFPWPQTFHFRPLPVVGGSPVLFAPSVALGAVAAAAWAFWIFRAFRRDRSRGLLVAAAAILALPILNVSYTGFPGTSADRFLYLPLLPFGIAVAVEAAPALARWSERALSPIVASAVALIACGVCWVRSLDYVSNETVWRHELEVNPENPQALAGLAQVMAARGDLDEATALLRRALSPEALKYKLLANPARYYLGFVELQGPRLADGNVSALEALLDELAALEGLRPRREPSLPPARAGDLVLAPPLWDEHFPIHLANASTHLAAAGALVASRLGHDHGADDLLHPFAARLGEGAALDGAAHYNLALAFGRAADYANARKELARAVARDGSATVRAAASALDANLTRVEQLRADARALPDHDARSLRAAAYLELGAYLRAARLLRISAAARPDDSAIVSAYVGALAHARLDAEADAVAANAPDKDAQLKHLAEERRGLSPRTAKAIPPPAGERWF